MEASTVYFMRRALISLRMPWFCVVVSGMALIVRASASLGQPAQRYPDSVGYDSFSFISTTDRPWPIPVIYSLAGSDSSRVVLQVIVGTLAWSTLAWVLSRNVKWQRTAFVITMILGVTPQIIRYDVAILSESLSISFAVFTIASTLYRHSVRSTFATAWWMVSLTLCVLSRPTHILIPAVCLVPIVWKFMSSRGKSLTMTGVGCLALFMLGVFTIQQSRPMSLLNLYTVVSSRVITDDQRFDWFTSHGMPHITEMREATGYDYSEQLPTDVADIVDLPKGQQPPSLMRVGGVQLATWMRDNGWKALARYLILNPADTLNHAQQLVHPTLNAPNGDFLPLQNGPMVPWSWFLSWQAWLIVFATCCGILFSRRATRSQATLLLKILIITAIVYVATVHSSGIEHVRHATTCAAVIRIIGLVALLAVLPRRNLNETPEIPDA